MDHKPRDEVSSPSGAAITKDEVPPCPDSLTEWVEADIDSWEVLDRRPRLEYFGNKALDKKSHWSPLPIRSFDGNGNRSGEEKIFPNYSIRRRLYDPESPETWTDIPKPQHKRSQPSVVAPIADKENSSQKNPMDYNSSPGPDPKPETDAVKGDSLITQASPEQPGSESLSWVSSQIDMLVAERRELLARIKKLEEMVNVEVQAAASKQMDVQEKINQILAEQAKIKRIGKKRESARKQDKEELKDELELVQGDIYSLAEDFDYMLRDYTALRENMVTLSDDFSL
ncbi:hypothetical protein F5Y13DRAFT_123968 [Hypoxylon sp. FL1857]|nr:hypothetical protein F5Y13DRAFT_123968 [Hypoxylon sp. FL1857]